MSHLKHGRVDLEIGMCMQVDLDSHRHTRDHTYFDGSAHYSRWKATVSDHGTINLQENLVLVLVIPATRCP
jgi:hypothetical protein